ncbi:hypothetical protein GCM10010306_082390 [Streptomyces umbrinus]|nr:hypothetical protein GCM10010306_082390 [Streptomyces umbrinus]
MRTLGAQACDSAGAYRVGSLSARHPHWPTVRQACPTDPPARYPPVPLVACVPATARVQAGRHGGQDQQHTGRQGAGHAGHRPVTG